MDNLILIKEKITIICFVIFLILITLIFFESLYIVRIIWDDSDNRYINDVNAKNIPVANLFGNNLLLNSYYFKSDVSKCYNYNNDVILNTNITQITYKIFWYIFIFWVITIVLLTIFDVINYMFNKISFNILFRNDSELWNKGFYILLLAGLSIIALMIFDITDYNLVKEYKINENDTFEQIVFNKYQSLSQELKYKLILLINNANKYNINKINYDTIIESRKGTDEQKKNAKELFVLCKYLNNVNKDTNADVTNVFLKFLIKCRNTKNIETFATQSDDDIYEDKYYGDEVYYGDYYENSDYNDDTTYGDDVYYGDYNNDDTTYGDDVYYGDYNNDDTTYGDDVYYGDTKRPAKKPTSTQTNKHASIQTIKPTSTQTSKPGLKSKIMNKKDKAYNKIKSASDNINLEDTANWINWISGDVKKKVNEVKKSDNQMAAMIKKVLDKIVKTLNIECILAEIRFTFDSFSFIKYLLWNVDTDSIGIKEDNDNNDNEVILLSSLLTLDYLKNTPVDIRADNIPDNNMQEEDLDNISLFVNLIRYTNYYKKITINGVPILDNGKIKEEKTYKKLVYENKKRLHGNIFLKKGLISCIIILMLSFILYKIYYNIYNPEYLKLLKEDAYRLSLNDNYDVTDGPKFLKSKYKIYKNSYEQTLYDDSNIFSWIINIIVVLISSLLLFKVWYIPMDFPKK